MWLAGSSWPSNHLMWCGEGGERRGWSHRKELARKDGQHESQMTVSERGGHRDLLLVQ